MNRKLWVIAAAVIILAAAVCTIFFLNRANTVVRSTPTVNWFMEDIAVGSSKSTSDNQFVLHVNSYTYEDVCVKCVATKNTVHTTITIPGLEKDYSFSLPDSPNTNRYSDWSVVDLPNGVKVTVCGTGQRYPAKDAQPEKIITFSVTSDGTRPVCVVPG